MESWRRFLKEDSEEFKPHMMYDPESGEGIKAETYEKHLELKEKGWVHEKPKVDEAITLDIEVGDILLGGKYKNKRVEVKEIGTDDIGQPTINGKSLLKFRIEKQLPDSKKSKKTKDAEKAKEEGEEE